MSLFIYGRNNFDLDGFSSFVSDQKDNLLPNDQISTCGLIPNISKNCLESFFDYAYQDDSDFKFKEINKKLSYYYLYLLDGLVLAAKMAVYYHKNKNSFDLSNLYRVERLHYYDNCYHMNYIPEKYANYLSDYLKKWSLAVAYLQFFLIMVSLPIFILSILQVLYE